MFKIRDGREHFYQWDLDRELIVDDLTIKEVHYCNRTDECSLVVDVIDGIAPVPNLILQKSFDVRVFAYDGSATRYDAVFKVKPRTKPSDYVYTETEIKTYENLEKRLDEIEEKGFSQEVIESALDEVLQSGSYNFATEQYVDDAVSNVKVDLTGYATEDYVDTAISNIDIPEVDLSDYAKKSEIPDTTDFITAIPEEYVTETELAAKGYLTEHQSLEGYAKKTDIPDTSSFLTEVPSEYITETELNDKGYLTEHQSLEGYATEQYVNDAIANIDIPEGGGGTIDTSKFLTKAVDSPSVYNWYVTGSNSSQIIQTYTPLERTEYALDHAQGINENTIPIREGQQLRVPTVPTADYHAASKSYVDSAIANIDISEGGEDASVAITDDGKGNVFIGDGEASVIELTNYYTKTEIDNKGYLTEHQSLEGYAKTTDIPDVSAFQTEAQVIALIEQYGGGGADYPNYEEVEF